MCICCRHGNVQMTGTVAYVSLRSGPDNACRWLQISNVMARRRIISLRGPDARLIGAAVYSRIREARSTGVAYITSLLAMTWPDLEQL